MARKEGNLITRDHSSPYQQALYLLTFYDQSKMSISRAILFFVLRSTFVSDRCQRKKIH